MLCLPPPRILTARRKARQTACSSQKARQCCLAFRLSKPLCRHFQALKYPFWQSG
jgi:hypothetical protein